MKANLSPPFADPQGELPLSRRASDPAVPQTLVTAQRTSAAAISLACSASGLEDKEIYLVLGINAGHWSRIKSGEAYFPLDRIAEFCRIVGNTVLPDWIAYQVGCGLVMLKSEAELRLEAAEKALAEERAKNRLLIDIAQGKA